MDAKKPTDVDLHIAGRIRYFRRLAGFSQEQLGAALGVSFQQVQKYENGRNRVSAGNLFALANALGQDVRAFYPGHADAFTDEGLAPEITDALHRLVESLRRHEESRPNASEMQ